MRCLIVSREWGVGQQWLLALENLSDRWACRCLTDADAALALLCREHWDVCLLHGDTQGCLAARLLGQRPPLAAPWLVTDGLCTPWADFSLTLAGAASLPGMLQQAGQQLHLPRLALARHGQAACLARSLVHALDIPPHLRANAFLPDMAALCAVYPPLLHNLRGGLYPLVAQRHGSSPAAVERSLRLAIEAAWNRSSLPALERFFGDSVDPEKGKPTNREFLLRLHDRLTFAARRIQQSPLPLQLGA